MDEFTEKQLERIREANFKMLERVFDDEPWADTTDELIAELRKKPVTFRKGELYWDGSRYTLKNAINPPALSGMRHLRLSEQSQALEDFVNGVVKAKSDIEEWLKSEDDSLDMYEIFKALSALEIPQ